MQFIEPNKLSPESFNAILETVDIQDKNREWLGDLFSDKGSAPDFEENLRTIIEKINLKISQIDTASFRNLFMFDPEIPDCFDLQKLASEKIKIIPKFFMPLWNDKYGIFKLYIAEILPQIKKYAEEDEAFSEAYQRKLNETREASTLAERVCGYLQMQKLPRPNYDKKPPSIEEVSAILSTDTNYPLNLVSELEGIPIEALSIVFLPFLVYGEEVYNYIRNAYFLTGTFSFPHESFVKNVIQQITIPKWNEQNHVHWIFFHLAIALKDITILYKIFEGIDVTKIPYLFFEYIKSKKSVYKILFMDCTGDSNLSCDSFLENVKYLDWLTSELKQPSAKEICQLFIDYLSSLAHESREDKIDLFRELFFPSENGYNCNSYPRENIKSVLDNLSREKWEEDSRGAKTLNRQLTQKEAETLYKKFIDIVAKEAASYSVETIIPLGNSGIFDDIKKQEIIQNIFMQRTENEYELDIFKRYCEHIKLKNTAEALLIGEYWYLRFHEVVYGLEFKSCYNKLSDFAETQECIRKKIFSRFIEDEDFVFRFLSIPKWYQNIAGDNGFYWLVFYLACWIIKPNVNQNNVSVCERAIEKMTHNRTISFPENIACLIRSNRNLIFEYAKDRMYDAAAFMLIVYTAVSSEEENPAIFEQIHDIEISFRLRLVQYKYMHTNFIPDEFMGYLFTVKEKSFSAYVDDEPCPLKMIRYACDENVISKKTVLRKLPEFIISKFDNNIVNRLSLLRSMRSSLEYFLKSKEQEDTEEQIKFFTVFFERVISNDENSPVELYTFLELWGRFANEVEVLFAKNQECLKTIMTLCSKELHCLKNVCIEQTDYHLYLPAYFLREKASFWKGIKPLFTAFRASKKILLNDNLSCKSSLPYEIIRFFHKDQKNIKQLRQDMANDFADYLKKTKQPRYPENYTEIEQKEAGFDVNYVEPSPFWRYAYVRALADLEVHADGRGHFLHEALANTAENDPSGDVRKAAEKACKELNNLRNGIAGNDHKKRLYEAFWWLRQAHMLSLGAKIDVQAALKTRIQEWKDKY